MIMLRYLDTGSLSLNGFRFYYESLPDYLKLEITNQKNLSDRKLKLGARLMIKGMLDDAKCGYLINQIQSGKNGKPFINGWKDFNISHSGSIVIIATSSEPVGVDIEEELDFEFGEVLNLLHINEQKYILDSSNIKEAFYDIWVKKEALLKSVGCGIVDGLNRIDCTKDIVVFEGDEFFLQKVHIHSGYRCYVSTAGEQKTIIKKRFYLKQS